MENDTTSLGLEPCPCCGGQVTAKVPGYGVAGVIACGNCKTLFLIPWDEAETLSELTHAWNGRTQKCKR
jgi:hypothetical protein